MKILVQMKYETNIENIKQMKTSILHRSVAVGLLGVPKYIPPVFLCSVGSLSGLHQSPVSVRGSMCECAHTYTHAHAPTCMHTHTHMCVHTHAQAYTGTHIQAHAHTCTHAYTDTHRHIHTHMHMYTHIGERAHGI